MQQNAASTMSLTEDEPRIKAVFRVMDGFLCLMSVLSALSADPSSIYSGESNGVVIVNEDEENSTQECIRWVFLVLSEAMEACPTNEVFFRTKIGWQMLGDALNVLLSTSSLRPHILSYLLALSLTDFDALYLGYFGTEAGNAMEMVDEKVAELKEKKANQRIRHAGSLRILWDVVEESQDRHARYALYKILELMFGVSHRNGGVLSSLGIVEGVFKRFEEVRRSLKSEDLEDGEKKMLDKEKQVLQRLLRKLLEMGATTSEARSIFQASVVRDASGAERLDLEILDVIRFGMKNRWVEHFSLEGRAAVALTDEKRWKTIPKDGLSFMVCFLLVHTCSSYIFVSLRCGSSLQRCQLNHTAPCFLRSPSQTLRHPLVRFKEEVGCTLGSHFGQMED